MTITDSGEKQLRRVLFVIGTAHYTSANHEAREDVPGILRRVVNTLTPLGFEVHFAPSGYLLDPDRNSLRTKIHQARAQGDIVVIYYTGHGEDIEHEGHYLITSDFDWATLPDAGLKVGTRILMLKNSGWPTWRRSLFPTIISILSSAVPYCILLQTGLNFRYGWKRCSGYWRRAARSGSE